MKRPSALNRQRAIYLNGASGRKPRVPVDLQALEEEARKIMSAQAFAYVSTGASREETLAANRRAFAQHKIVQRMLRDVSERDTSIELFGESLSSPLMLAPIGVLEMAHPKAEIPVAEACKATDTPLILSSQASVPMEKVSRVMPDTLNWFQLYWSKSNRLTESFVKRAEDCGCKAIVLTLDTTILGWRTRDLNLGYSPFLRGMGIAQYTSDPVFNELIHEPIPENPGDPPRKVNLQAIATLFAQAKNVPGSFWTNLRTGRSLKSVRAFTHLFVRPDLNWKNLNFLRKITDLPILLKGIVHPEDAKLAVSHGMDGLIVSNHGGRQVDGAIGSLDVLKEITEVVEDRIPVLLDSGIRSGADVFKALALGAKAVCIGRPYVYGLALAGQKGVEEVIANLKADFELTMALSGCRSVGEIGENNLRKR